MSHWFRSLAFSACLLFLAACSGNSTPRQIASYPAGGESRSYAVPPAAFVYDAQMELEVYEPLSALETASRLVGEFGGWLVSSQTTRWDRQEQVTAVLAVPAYNFEALHAALLRLGRLNFERISGEWDGHGWSAYSEVTVTFVSAAVSLPSLPGHWNPGRTLRRAFEVSLAVFGFLADLLIWVVVVAGPFALVGWGILRLVRRLQRRS